jgi:gamma-glutamylcyclotransferase (GGCT)/AIG2-like uncharacterized protein YtfP
MNEEYCLFSYGTLQLPQVQLANYGHLLEGTPDALPGYRLDQLAISDPTVVELSRTAVHHIARRTGRAEDQVTGTVFLLSRSELDATDRYEVADYARVLVRLASGREAWAYVARP